MTKIHPSLPLTYYTTQQQGLPFKNAVILLHGLGSNAQDMLSLAENWQQHCPQTLFIAPNAPQPFPEGLGFQWFPLTQISPVSLKAGINQATPIVLDFIEKGLKAFNLDYTQLILCGFSQGAMLAANTGLLTSKPIAGVIAYSGGLFPPLDVQQKPPFLLSHGSLDEVIPQEALIQTQALLEEQGIITKTYLDKNLGHSIGPLGLKQGELFIKKHLY